MAKGDDIQDRLVKFAARVIKVCEKMPDGRVGTHIAKQLLRSGTSPAPNYAEGRAAESTSDFIHKLKVAHKELNESEVWMLIIVESGLMTQGQLHDLVDECQQLQRILAASINTARKNL